ncbi:hypothetical protein HUU05_18115 [candidate division KSB1 bacterium]|nr:hypothetical protein [candidate division KSB1 bacterium]
MEAIFVALILGSFGLIGWSNHLRNQRHHVAVQAKTDRFNKIIDRFSADEELLKFLQSEKGQATLNKLVATGKGTKVPILVTASAGIVSIFIGLGAALIALTYENDLIFGAVFMSALGLGLLTAATFSYFMARKWGLFHESRLDEFGRDAITAQ